MITRRVLHQSDDGTVVSLIDELDGYGMITAVNEEEDLYQRVSDWSRTTRPDFFRPFGRTAR